MLLLLILCLILIVIIILLGIWIWYHPEFILTPLNYLYNLDTSFRTNFYSDIDCDRIFPIRNKLESVWQDIKREGYELYDNLSNKDINYLDNYHMNMNGENKSNWTTIPLRLFGRDSKDYIHKCPITHNILKIHPEIKSCLFSIMKPGKIIKSHVGPYDGLLRYQLALDIPKPNNPSEECYLHVGGEQYIWTEGKGILFDEANLHGAVNTTSKKRMVLLIDIERPYSFFLYRLLNKLVIWILGSLPATKQATLF